MKTKALLFAVSLTLFLTSCNDNSKALLEKFKANNVKLLVCPTHILSNASCSYDTLSSNRIVNYLNGNKYANASLVQFYPPPNNTWRHNEAKMLTESINLFVEYVKKLNLPENTYILYPEFLKLGRNETIIGIHYCLLNNTGELVIRGLINSHWKAYQKVNPKTNNDCVDVFINGFEDHLKQ